MTQLIINFKYLKVITMLFYILFLESCVLNRKEIFFENLFLSNIDNKEIRIIPIDTFYGKCLNEVLKQNKKFNYCVRIIDKVKTDSIQVQDFYTENIYFVGKLLNGIRVGYWRGYYEDNLILETAYLEGNPTFLRLYNKHGKPIKSLTFNIF